MNTTFAPPADGPAGLPGPLAGQTAPRVWAVGALARAVGDALAARFNPVTVRGEVSGFTRAASGHCYFSLKDETGQLRCAMFRRAATLLDFAPREGDQVQVRGRLAVYEPRGDLQLVAESMERAGQGALFEQFLRLKERLQAQGLFDPARKRALPAMPRAIGIVTSPQAAALHDVLTALARRAPHIPVLLAPAAVQGASAAGELCQALARLYRRAAPANAANAQGAAGAGQAAGGTGQDAAPSAGSDAPQKAGAGPGQGAGKQAAGAGALPRSGTQAMPPVDVILLVRGGGALEDLWAFNDEQLARTIAASPVPVISGVGHETDFTIADFVADLRAPTPTAAAELACPARSQWQAQAQALQDRLTRALHQRLDAQAQQLDWLATRLARPSQAVAAEHLRLHQWASRLRHGQTLQLERERARLHHLASRLQHTLPPPLAAERLRLQNQSARLPAALAAHLRAEQERLHRIALRLDALAPQRVLERGYAWLQDAQGHPLTRAAQAQPGQPLTASLSDGQLDLTVTARHPR